MALHWKVKLNAGLLLVWALTGLIVSATILASFRFKMRPLEVSNPTSVTEHRSEPEGPAYAAGYVGPQACAECHAERVAEFMGTQHYRACREAGPGTMPAVFSAGKSTFHTATNGVSFEMSRSGNDFIQTSVRSTPDGQQRSNAPIDLIYGAGTADDVYLNWRGEQLYELPVAWLHASKKWGASFFDPHGGGDFSRPLTPRCLECHNTWFHHVPGTENQYKRDDFILGVTCERCHGPGREHVAWHRTQPGADSGHAIIHPGRLSRQRQLDLCTQCHSNAIKLRRPPFTYLPGEPLEDAYKAIRTKYTEDDHVANQIQYLSQSKCFQNSETLTCVTCHNPHRPQTPRRGSATCVECHQPDSCVDAPRQPMAVRDNCVGCHMPSYYKINVCFQTEDDSFYPPIRRYDHRIGVHPHARQEVLFEWYRTQSDPSSVSEVERLSAELISHWLAEAESCRRQYRFTGVIAAIREALRVQNTPELRQQLKEAVAVQTQINANWAEAVRLINDKQNASAVQKFEQILAVKPTDAKSHGKLGMLFATAGDRQRATQHLIAVAEYDPDDAYGLAMLGWLEYLDKRYEQALDYFRHADEIEPYNGKIQFQMGLTLAMLERTADSVDRFRKALEIEPQRLDACQCLVVGLRQQGKPVEALTFARHAVQLTGNQNLQTVLALVETCAEASRFAEAADSTVRAIELAQSTQPALVNQLQRHLEEFRKLAVEGKSQK